MFMLMHMPYPAHSAHTLSTRAVDHSVTTREYVIHHCNFRWNTYVVKRYVHFYLILLSSMQVLFRLRPQSKVDLRSTSKLESFQLSSWALSTSSSHQLFHAPQPRSRAARGVYIWEVKPRAETLDTFSRRAFLIKNTHHRSRASGAEMNEPLKGRGAYA